MDLGKIEGWKKDVIGVAACLIFTFAVAVYIVWGITFWNTDPKALILVLPCLIISAVPIIGTLMSLEGVTIDWRWIRKFSVSAMIIFWVPTSVTTLYVIWGIVFGGLGWNIAWLPMPFFCPAMSATLFANMSKEEIEIADKRNSQKAIPG